METGVWMRKKVERHGGAICLMIPYRLKQEWWKSKYFVDLYIIGRKVFPART